jgi:hypothetical protein
MRLHKEFINFKNTSVIPGSILKLEKEEKLYEILTLKKGFVIRCAGGNKILKFKQNKYLFVLLQLLRQVGTMKLFGFRLYCSSGVQTHRLKEKLVAKYVCKGRLTSVPFSILLSQPV